MELVLNTPSWFLIICLLAGFAYSFYFYFFRPRDSFNLTLRILLSAFRFICVSLICFLLVSPLLKSSNRNIEKPIIVLAHDNSESILLNEDSGYYRSQYPENYKEFVAKLSKDFEVQTYTFGKNFTAEGKLDFSDNLTDMAGVLKEISSRYYHRNLGALILASDGLYNHGHNPIHELEEINAPIFGIALGDTALQKDLVIRQLLHNKVAFTGNRFQAEVQIAAYRSAGERFNLTILHEGRSVFSKPISPKSENYTEVVTVSLEAGSPGLKRFSALLSPLKAEISQSNNRRDFYIEVLENKLKIAIVAQSPHPDIAALKFALENNKNYEVESFTVDKFTKPVSSYNMFVLHQLPGANRSHDNLIRSIRQAGIPVFYVVGKQTQINSFNDLRTGVSIIVSRAGFNESLPVVSTDFSLFGFNESTLRLFESYPPLISWFADYRLSNAANVLLKHRIGRVNTQMPLLFFMDDGCYRSAVLLGEGLWKWRMSCFAMNKNHEAFNELINKTSQYLSLKGERDFFRISGEYLFNENQAVEFYGELYNDNYELVNTPEISFVIRNQENKRFDYVFSRREKDYFLNAGFFPPGDYQWESKVILGGKQGVKKGKFSVAEVQTERALTRANHNLLYQITERSKGSMFYPKQFEQLYQAIKERDDIKPLYRVRKKLSELIEFKWIFLLLLFLLSFEWVIRKRSGSY